RRGCAQRGGWVEQVKVSYTNQGILFLVFIAAFSFGIVFSHLFSPQLGKLTEAIAAVCAAVIVPSLDLSFTSCRNL
ncbi:MAG: hypothetical protein Q4615_04530, partial [Paracoccus aminovorans]|nr:hypothetical protein [Paracoccus aminovorans]